MLVQNLIRQPRYKRILFIPKVYKDAYSFYRLVMDDGRCSALYWAFRSVLLLVKCKRLTGGEIDNG
jgi:hypothetical protein